MIIQTGTLYGSANAPGTECPNEISTSGVNIKTFSLNICGETLSKKVIFRNPIKPIPALKPTLTHFSDEFYRKVVELDETFPNPQVETSLHLPQPAHQQMPYLP